MRFYRFTTMLTTLGMTLGILGCGAMPFPTDVDPSHGGPASDADQAAVELTLRELMATAGAPIGEAPSPQPYETFQPQPWGTWHLENGSMLDDFVTGLATFGVTTDVTGIILNENGTGRLFLADRLTGAKDCLRFFVLFDGETLVVDFAAERTTDFEFNLAIEETHFVYPFVVSGANTLGIADASGQIAIFSRGLPGDLACRPVEVLDDFVVPQPQFFSDAAYYNGDLVYASSQGQLEAFDLDTDAIIAPLGPVSSRLIQTSQGGFFWTHCGCGGSRDAFKRTLQSVFDTVSSEDEMGGPITFRAMAYSATTDRLWLHGRDFDTQFGRFYVMNTNGEPDVIDDEISFNRDLRALSLDASDELWGVATIATQVLVHIDTTTGKVIESYEVPDEDVSWSGLIFDDEGYMYMLGTNLDGDGVLLRVAHP